MNDAIHYVKYNNITLNVTGDLSYWPSEKSISFEALNDDPGTIEIRGKDFQDCCGSPVNSCVWGGLVLHCTASNTSSPWHNFVSDDIHWKDEYNNMPCENDGGMMAYGAGLDIIKYFKSVEAKKIWASRQTVTLRGTPKRA